MSATPNRPSGHAHKLIAATAKAMAHELYDETMRNNEWHKWWKAQYPSDTPQQREARFVNKNAAKLLAAARAMLARRLDLSHDPVEKETIYQALLLDSTLIRGRH